MALLNEPSLININLTGNSHVHICGDIHGQFNDLKMIFERLGPPSSSNKYMFLGDYVDRGRQGIEVMLLLLCYKIMNINSIYLLRGNHESSEITRLYGFFDECKRRYKGPKAQLKLWKLFVDMFNCLPLAATVGPGYPQMLCMHGGLSPDMNKLNDINNIKRPLDVPDNGLMCDLLWADPNTEPSLGDRGWIENDRGVSYVFCRDVLKKFLDDNDIELICRAHQVVEDGYEFWSDRKLVTVFSAPRYCGEFDNKGGVMTVNSNMRCSFTLFD
jgi:serine/threonine-protein phosphatase PP1 catalytic subunit